MQVVKFTLFLLLVSLLAVHSTKKVSGAKLSCTLYPPPLFGISTCSGDLCVAQRKLAEDGGQPSTVLICMDKTRTLHWRDYCDGIKDSNDSVHQCCREDGCNSYLKPRLRHEPSEPGGLEPYRPIDDPEDDPTQDGLYVCDYKLDKFPLDLHPGFCYGERCYTERERVDGEIRQNLGCLNSDSEDVSAICDGLQNTEETAYSCCYEPERCNRDLYPRFPSELVNITTDPTTEENESTGESETSTEGESETSTEGESETSTIGESTNPTTPVDTSKPPVTTPSTSSSPVSSQHEGPLNSNLIGIIVLLAVVVPIILIVAVVLIVSLMLWKTQQAKKEVRLKHLPVPSGAESPVSLESDSSDSRLRRSLA